MTNNPRFFLIDFLNIAYQSGKPELRNFELVLSKLRSLDPSATILGIADPHSIKVIDDQDRYEQLVKTGVIRQVPSKGEADFYMLKFAEMKPNCYLVSNDTFKDYELKNGVKERIIQLTIIGDEVIFSEKIMLPWLT